MLASKAAQASWRKVPGSNVPSNVCSVLISRVLTSLCDIPMFIICVAISPLSLLVYSRTAINCGRVGKASKYVPTLAVGITTWGKALRAMIVFFFVGRNRIGCRCLLDATQPQKVAYVTKSFLNKKVSTFKTLNTSKLMGADKLFYKPVQPFPVVLRLMVSDDSEAVLQSVTGAS